MKPKIVGAARVTSKAQTVIPKAVRETLGVKPGDRVRYRLTREGIVIEKAAEAEDDPFASFAEWASEADAKAYDGL